jgi:hypothetical protein
VLLLFIGLYKSQLRRSLFHYYKYSHSRALRTKKGEERVVTSSKRFHEAFPLLTEMTKVVEHYNCISNSNNNKKRRATRKSLTTAAHILTTAAKTKLTRICVV